MRLATQRQALIRCEHLERADLLCCIPVATDIGGGVHSFSATAQRRNRHFLRGCLQHVLWIHNQGGIWSLCESCAPAPCVTQGHGPRFDRIWEMRFAQARQGLRRIRCVPWPTRHPTRTSLGEPQICWGCGAALRGTLRPLVGAPQSTENQRRGRP